MGFGRLRAILTSGRLWLVVIGVAAFGLLVAHAALSLFDFGDRKFVRNTERDIQDLVYETLMVGAALVVFARAIIKPHARLGWFLIGASLAFDAAADLYYILAFDAGQIPFPSTADAIYFASYPTAAAGVILVSGMGRGRATFSPALGVTLLGLLTLWSWLIFSHVVEHTTGTTAEVMTTLAYPLLDIVVLAFVIVSLAGRGWRLNVPFAALLAGFATFTIADGIYAYQESHGIYREWTILDTMWPLSAVLVATAAWFQTGAPRPGIDARRLALALSSGAVAVAITVLVWDHFKGFDHVTIALAAITLVVAIVDLVILNRARDRAETRALAAAAENEGLAAIVRSSEDAIISADLTGVVTAWNDGAEKIYGFTAEEAIGRPIYELTIPAGRSEEADRLLETAAGGDGVAFETTRQRKNGRLVDVSIRAFPVRDGAGAVTGVSVSAHDITDRRRREEAELQDREGRIWRGRIKSALANGNFVFWGQPVVDLTRERVDHWELLLRMMLDDEPVSPNEFIGHAEASDLIHEIDQWAVRQGIEFARELPVAINLSAKSLGDRGLIALVREALADSRVAPGNLTFELTETAAAENLEGAAFMVRELRSLGCRVALDDFGTGFNSFTYLKYLPVTALKIDMQFVRKLTDDPSNERIVSSVVSIARNFGMTTVAEGVEDEATLDLLRELGVDAVQGYYVGYPARMSATPQHPKMVTQGWHGSAAAIIGRG